MRMKAALVSSLAYRPALIMLDEPFSGLDPLVRDELIEGLLERAPETTIFLSSHDLAEIESFSSHVGYLENGRLLFSEEMSALTDRFRDVRVTLETPSPLPSKFPDGWLQPQMTDRVIRFVHSNYRAQLTEHELATAFPAARGYSLEPMPLREIFLAVARNGRRNPFSGSDQASKEEAKA